MHKHMRQKIIGGGQGKWKYPAKKCSAQKKKYKIMSGASPQA
jgi:hypothetical protein